VAFVLQALGFRSLVIGFWISVEKTCSVGVLNGLLPRTRFLFFFLVFWETIALNLFVYVYVLILCYITKLTR